MKTPSSFLAPWKSGLLALLGMSLAAVPAHAAGPKALQFTSSVTNTSGSVMTLDHPALNGKPKTNVIINHRYVSNFNNHPLGLQYNTTVGKWQVRNEDGGSIPINEGINVLLAPGTKRLSTNAFTTYNYEAYFPTVAPNKPNALLLATHVINTGGFYTGVLLTDPYSMFYFNNTWSIYTDNIAPMKAVGFNIADVTKLKANGQPIAFQHIAGAGNISGDLTFFDNPLTNNKPGAVVFARHIWAAASGVYMTKEVGVYYTGTRWSVYTEDGSAMPNGEAFIIAVIPQASP